jgi:flagellar hook-length control protein FliK
MTSPVTTAAAPAAPAGAASDAGGSDSAAPFASALDGALTAADGADARTGRGASGEQEQADAEAATETAAEPVPTAPGGVVAALWALLTGAGAAGPATEPTAGTGRAAAGGTAVPPVGTPVAAGHTGALAPGQAVAQTRAAGAAYGLLGTPPGTVAETAPVDAATPDVATPVPATAVPPPAAAAARAAAEALAAIGIHGLTVETSGSSPGGTATAAPAAPVPAAASAPPDGEGTPAAGPAPAAAAPSATDVVRALAPGSSGDTAADTGSGAGTGSGDQTGSARTDAVAVTGQAAATAATTAVPRAEAATGTAAATPVSGQIAQRVAVLRGGPDGSHTMTVVLTPENLGPVEVSVTVSQGTVELTLRGAHEHGRAALLDAIPDLRRDLESAGLTCSRLDVDRGNRDGSWSAAQQNGGRFGDQGPGGRGGQQDRPHGEARPWHRSADTGEGPRASTRSASGLDVRV